MDKISKDKAMAAIRSQSGDQQTGRQRSEVEREIVNRFFQSLALLYGDAKIRSAWPTPELKDGAKRLWADDIINLGWAEVNRRLQVAKSRLHLEEYQWPNVALILQGDRQPGASGTASESYKPASEALRALPRPVLDKSKGNAHLERLKAGLEAEIQGKENARASLVAEQRAELTRLTDKHVPYGFYLRRTDSGDYVTTSIPHPYRSLTKGEHYLND